MPKWEYMVESILAANNATHMVDLVARMNELGQDGWEAIDLRWLPVSQFLTITFKREAQEPAPNGPVN